MALREVPGVPPEAVAAMAADLGLADGTVGAAPGRDEADPLPPDHEVLFPDREIRIQGEDLTVREYTFKEGLRIGTDYRCLLADLAGLFLPVGAASAATVEIADLQAVLGNHGEAILDLVGLSIGRPAAWVGDLSDADGQALLLTWWTCNRDFFGRRLAAAAIGRRRAPTAESGDSSPS
jgi:hypothetical protein